MYKIKTSKKEMREASYYILGVSYCELQYLLRAESPIAYSCGVYGWSCDYYNIPEENIILSTGYSYIEQNITHDYKLQKKYEEKARKINHDSKLSWQQIQKKLHSLLLQYIREEKARNKKEV